MDDRDGELCEEGNALWLDIFRGYSDEKCKRYIDHIISCAECMKGLGIDEVIPEDSLEPILRMERKCLVSYAEGIKCALCLAAAAVVLVAVGVYVLF